MGHNRTQQATPDLFSTTPVGERTPPTTKQASPAQEQRYMLPKDLPAAVKHLTDSELELLITVSIEEAKRRGRLPPSAQQKARPVPKRSLTTNKRQVHIARLRTPRQKTRAIKPRMNRHHDRVLSWLCENLQVLKFSPLSFSDRSKSTPRKNACHEIRHWTNDFIPSVLWAAAFSHNRAALADFIGSRKPQPLTCVPN
jgi:hypothetical protein